MRIHVLWNAEDLRMGAKWLSQKKKLLIFPIPTVALQVDFSSSVSEQSAACGTRASALGEERNETDHVCYDCPYALEGCCCKLVNSDALPNTARAAV